MKDRNIFLTVDVECHNLSKKNQYIDGIIHNEYWGLRKILDLGKEAQIPINFFLDVGECKEYGDGFIRDVIKLVNSYNQPIFLHLHPDYISGDHNRTFFWMYSKKEKKKILEEAVMIYDRMVPSGIHDGLIFRAGRYGIDSELLSLLRDLPCKVLDLSYVYNAPKMCHLKYDEVKTINCAKMKGSVTLLPTTRFIGFDFFGKKKCIGFDSSEATFSEFKRIIDKTKLNNLVWTMHSWHFIRKFFFFKTLIFKDKAGVRKFKKSIRYAESRGFCFRNLYDFKFEEEPDEIINLCLGLGGKIKALFNNFRRFQRIACLNPMYFKVYLFFYLFIAAMALGILFSFISK